MKKLLLISILLLCQSAYAQCTGEKKYNSTWSMDDKNIILKVQMKDKTPLHYYEFFDGGFKFIDVPYKINTDITIKLPDDDYKVSDSYGSFLYKGISPQRIQELFYPYNSISQAVKGVKHSQVFSFPLDNKELQTKMIYTREFNYPSMIQFYKHLLTYNNLYGKHKVKFYVNLLESPDLKECALFESPVVELDLGRKPFSKIWKEIWE